MSVFRDIREHFDWDKRQFAVVVGFIIFLLAIAGMIAWLNLEFWRAIL